MIIKEICTKNVHREGTATLTMNERELLTLTNLLFIARDKLDLEEHLDKSEIESSSILNAELITAFAILHHGSIPEFERNLIDTLYDSINHICDRKDKEVEVTHNESK